MNPTRKAGNSSTMSRGMAGRGWSVSISAPSGRSTLANSIARQLSCGDLAKVFLAKVLFYEPACG
eukprot:2461867-Amphidinium_carterae.1